MQISQSVLVIFCVLLISAGCQSDSCDHDLQPTNMTNFNEACPCDFDMSYSYIDGACIPCGVQNCMICDYQNDLICDKCIQMFQTNSEGQCVRQCSEPVCDCPATSVLKPDGSCVDCSVDNCMICKEDDETVCDHCQQGFFLQDGLCIERCSEPVCDCPATFVLTKQGQCLDCLVSDCVVCREDDGSFCDICRSGYILINNKTQCSICTTPFCQVCSQDDLNQCTECINGFLFNNDTKSCQIPVCNGGQIFTGDSCQCPEGQYFDGSICQNCADGCMQCSTDIQCNICFQGYFLSEQLNSLTCRQCPENCIKCQIAGTCDRCRAGYTYDQGNNSCIMLPDEVSGFFVLSGVRAICPGGCRQCSSLSQCSVCSRGRALENGLCKKCRGNCQTCSFVDRSVCTSCYSGFSVVDFQCIKCDDNCKQCLIPNYCLQCNTGYFLEQGVCKECGQDCLQCNNIEQCVVCMRGLASVNGKCTQCVIGCRQCNSEDISQCQICLDGFYMNSGTCVPCPLNCRSCESQTNCNECESGFYLDGNICYQNCKFPCATCLNGSPQECNSCYSGYSLNDKTCEADLTCTSLSQCSCPLGFVLIDDTCTSCAFDSSSNCATCSAQNLNECTSCNLGFALSEQNICQACQVGCRNCQSPQFCITCQDGYYMKKKRRQSLGICELCSTETHYCQTCKNQADYCTSCTNNFTLRGKTCRSFEHIKATFVFVTPLVQFTGKIRSFKIGLTSLLGGLFSGRTHLIILVSIISGSTIVQAQITIPPEQNSQEVFQKLSEQLSQGATIGQLELEESAELSRQNFQTADPDIPTNQDEQAQANLGLILGLSIPLGIICLILIILLLKTKKNHHQDKYRQSAESDNQIMNDNL